jgi:hypothetical protein
LLDNQREGLSTEEIAFAVEMRTDLSRDTGD